MSICLSNLILKILDYLLMQHFSKILNYINPSYMWVKLLDYVHMFILPNFENFELPTYATFLARFLIILTL